MCWATRHDRESILSLVANQLLEGGYRHLRAQGMRSKHVEHLVGRWHAENIAPGTFKNRMSALRWLAEKIDKQNIVARDNARYGIAERSYVANESKGQALDADKLNKIKDPYTALHLGQRLSHTRSTWRRVAPTTSPDWQARRQTRSTT